MTNSSAVAAPLKEMVESLVRSIVEEPEGVTVDEVSGRQETIFEVRVAQPDIGRVVGREGRVIKALRTLVRAAAARDQKEGRVDIEVLD